MENYLKIAVAGEIDAGKSTLIGRFLYDMGSVSKEAVKELKNTCQRLDRDLEFAYLLDSFEEERINQLTIDTTQIFCKDKNGNGFIFIDVPGHREFLKNMLCGSSDADKALLVIDVRKSMEEGTVRHCNVLKFLGIEEITLIFNKMDMVNFDKNIFEESKERAGEFLKKINIKPNYSIPLSAKSEDNLIKASPRMPWYKGPSLLEVLNKLNQELAKTKKEYFYFPIQDTYCINGKKVYVGNIISGGIKRGETVEATLSENKFKVKEIKVFNKNKALAKAEEAVGFVLSGSDDLRRGQIIYKESPPEVTTQILAKIICIYPLNLKDKFLFKCLTQKTHAYIKQIHDCLNTASSEIARGVSELKETDAAYVTIVTEDPIAVRKFSQTGALGRFVLQNDGEIYAAGIIL